MAENGKRDSASLRTAVRNFVVKKLVKVHGGFNLDEEEDEVKDAVGELPQSEAREGGWRRSINLGRRPSLQRTQSVVMGKGKLKSRWAKFSSSTLDLSTFSSHDLELQVFTAPFFFTFVVVSVSLARKYLLSAMCTFT